MSTTFQEEALFEMQFWMQILGDHARFIHDALAPTELIKISKAKQYKETFDHLLQSSRHPVQIPNLIKLIKQGKTAAEQFRKYKLTLIKEHLVGEIKISLGPTFINHMVNELEEWLRIANYLENGNPVPPSHALHHHVLWILDAAGHAGAINDNLDRVEKKLKQKGTEFTKEWEDFYLKAVELVGFLRTNVHSFPALSKFNSDVEMQMIIFKSFLRELEEMELNKEILGVLTPLMADHMAREECYYLTKLAQSTNEVKQPNCNPTKPRTKV